MAFHQNGVPIRPLEVSINAARSAVSLVFSLLLPQAVLLFNYGTHYEHALSEGEALIDAKPLMTREERNTSRIEQFIMEIAYKCFHKSCITDRHFRDKRSLVDHVLNDLVERQLLHEGIGETAFFNTGRCSTTKTYLKFMPASTDEQRFRDVLARLYRIDYDDYKKKFEHAPLSPSNYPLTSYGRAFLCQAQYRSITSGTGRTSSIVFWRRPYCTAEPSLIVRHCRLESTRWSNRCGTQAIVRTCFR